MLGVLGLGDTSAWTLPITWMMLSLYGGIIVKLNKDNFLKHWETLFWTRTHTSPIHQLSYPRFLLIKLIKLDKSSSNIWWKKFHSVRYIKACKIVKMIYEMMRNCERWRQLLCEWSQNLNFLLNLRLKLNRWKWHTWLMVHFKWF